MRLNIEWIAPWRFGTPIKNLLFRVHGSNRFDPSCWGIWFLGFYIHWTSRATTHGFGFNIQL